jgi:hypothetical protein
MLNQINKCDPYTSITIQGDKIIGGIILKKNMAIFPFTIDPLDFLVVLQPSTHLSFLATTPLTNYDVSQPKRSSEIS